MGGWTISWQGYGNTPADFPHATTIFQGIKQNVEAAGGTATLSVDGSFAQKPDVAIVVFGENPYAEGVGDRPDVDFQPANRRALKLLQSLRAQGIPVVSVFISGRPLYVTPEINASNAFVAAWLPGSEGEGISDVLFSKPDGAVAYDFRGTLPFSWPRAPDQTPLNVGTSPYNPLFAYGYGLRYETPRNLGDCRSKVRAGHFGRHPQLRRCRPCHGAMVLCTDRLQGRNCKCRIAPSAGRRTADIPVGLADGVMERQRFGEFCAEGRERQCRLAGQ